MSSFGAKRVLIVPMAAMAETAGSFVRTEILAARLIEHGFVVATCMAEDVNYKPLPNVKNNFLEVPSPLGLPRFISKRTFPLAQKFGLTAGKRVNSFDDVLFFTGNSSYTYLKKSIQNIRQAIKAFNPDIVYSEFNLSAVIAAKLEQRTVFASASFPTQPEYAVSPQFSGALNRILAENNLPKVSSALEIFKQADRRFVPSIKELEPFEDNSVVFCGSWKHQKLPECSLQNKNKVLVYMGSGSISAKKMAAEISKAFSALPYEVYIAAKGHSEESHGNIHIASRWNFAELLPEAALFIHHGGQNSTADSFVYGVPQLIYPGRVFERIFNASSVEKNGAGLVIPFKEFSAGVIRKKAEAIFADFTFTENACNIGALLVQQGGADKVIEALRNIK